MGFLFEMGAAIPSKAFDVWRRLYARFELEPGPVVGSAPEVGTSIIPVTQVDDLLRTPRLIKSALTDLSGAGSLTIAMVTVPAGERWRVITIFRTSTIAGSRVKVIDTEGVNANLSISGTGERMVEPGATMTLDEGWALGMQETGDAGDTSEQLHVWADVEKAFN